MDSVSPTGVVMWWVLNVQGTGARVYGMSEGQFQALKDSLKLGTDELKFLTMCSREEDAVIYCADYVKALAKIRSTDISQLLALGK